MTKTLIVYGTRMGMAAKTADVIAEVLSSKHKHTVDVVNLKKSGKVNLDDYKNVIIGTGIAIGQWTRPVKKFLKNNLKDKKVCFYVCSGEARAENSEEKLHVAIKKYIDDKLVKYPKIKPVATTAFGGRLIMFGKPMVDNWKKEHIEDWVKEISKNLK
ncbi:MAG: hypothetical protein HZR80_07900 [Candidatus Heimdallarchaeota archaeon]